MDEQLLVVEKPSGLLSVPGRDPRNADCVLNRLLDDYPDARIVHRLDLDTSGLLVLARGAEALSNLSRQFQRRTVEKRYVAVVAGEVIPDQGEIELPLITDWPNRPRQMVCHQQGKWSLTRYRVMERGQGRSRLELFPVTGRSHQLRLHCAALGHPIVGDPFYAPDEVRGQSGRLLLHAESIHIDHPVTGKRLSFQSPAPF